MLKIKGLYLPMLADRVVSGDVYFLNASATNANDAPGNGKDPSKPFATLDYALGKVNKIGAKTDNGDTLVVGAYHTETVTGAGGITLDTPGLEIIGLGRYDSRPRFLMDGSTITGLVTAANMSIENCVFAAGHSDIAVALLVTAKGFALKKCHFERNTTNENFVNVVSGGAADNDCDGLQVIDNTLDFAGDAGELTPIKLNKDTKDVRIIGNYIYGDFDTTPFAAIYSASTEHHMNIEIAYNKIHNLHNADAVSGISVGSTTSTGFMHNNYVYSLDVAGETPFVSAATGIAMFENYTTYDGGTTSGLLYPAVGTLS